MRPWIRILYVKLFNDRYKERSFIVGKTIDDSKKPKIEVSGSKYASAVKDSFTVKIWNLGYDEMIQIISRQLFHVQVFAGYLGDQNYDNFEGQCLFDGGLVNIVNSKKEWKDNICTLICASQMIANANRYRLNFSFGAGINLYSAMKYVARRAEVGESNISERLRDFFFSQAKQATGSAGNWLESLQNSYDELSISTDSSSGSALDAFNLRRGNRRAIDIDPSKGMIIGDSPEATSNGVTFNSLPVYNYIPGDVLRIDNSIIDTSSGQDSIGSSGYTSTTNAVYLDNQGLYVLYEISWQLSNTNGEFMGSLTCKARSLWENATGE